jgi:succinyl-diaminopimelate desuccinylase
MAFVPDMPSFLKEVEIAEKGLLNVRVTFHGRQAHSSMPEAGVSALSALAELMVKTERWMPRGGDRPHALLSPATCVIAMAEAGVAHNIVPGKASAVYNVRFLPNQTADGIAAELRELAEEVAARRPGTTVAVEKLGELAPSEIKADEPVARSLCQAMAEVAGIAPKLVGLGGATLCKQLIWAGIPAAAFGPGDPAMPHMADERIAIDELVRYTAIVIGASLKLIR